jgi:hypothetical protein
MAMLIISKDQQRALGKPARETFLNDLCTRFVERSPDLAKTLDADQVRTAVNCSVDAAESCGFTTRGPIRMYFDLCQTFGIGFVDDPIYQWAAKAIANRDPDTQAKRAEILYEKALTAIDEIFGLDDAHARAALKRLNSWAREPRTFEAVDADSAASEMRSLHPEKATHGGDEALRELFTRAEKGCLRLGVTSPRAVMLATALEFAFGAGCFDDPFYPWIGATAMKEGVKVPADRFVRLEKKALIWMDAVLDRNGAS